MNYLSFTSYSGWRKKFKPTYRKVEQKKRHRETEKGDNYRAIYVSESEIALFSLASIFPLCLVKN